MNIQDIIEEIEGLNHMIEIHNTSDSHFTCNQYKQKREKLFLELRNEISKIKEFDFWKDWKDQ